MKFNLILGMSARMWQGYLLFFVLFSTLTLQAQNNSAVGVGGNCLLIINTYTSDAPWSNGFIEPVQKWMNEADLPVLIEHLNMLMVGNADDFTMVEESIFRKHANHTPKAVLLLGNPSLLLKEAIRAHWGDIPLILCAEDDFYGPPQAYIEKKSIACEQRVPLSTLSDEYNLTVLHAKMFLKDNVDLLRHLLPRLKEVILIGDDRYVNQQLDCDMKHLMADEYPNLEYCFYSAESMTLDSLLFRLNDIDIRTTGVLFSSWFSKFEIAGQPVLNANSYRVIANMNVPIFALKGSVMNNSGMLGGCIYDEEEFLAHLKETLLSVVSGTPAREIPFFIPSGSIPTFNYLALLQKNFSSKQCPANSVFFGRPENFFQKYKYVFGGIFFVILSFVLFLSHRIRILAKLNEVQQRQVETSRELSTLFENMPVAYMKAKLLYNETGGIADMEIQRMNGRFMMNFAADEVVGGYKGSELLGSDFVMTLHFAELAHIENKTITYTQYFAKPNIYLNIVVAPAAQKDYIDIFCVDDTELYRTQQKFYDTNCKLAMALDVANIIPWNWDLQKHRILCDVNSSIELGYTGVNVDAEKFSVPDTEYFSKIFKEDKERVEHAYRDLIEGRIGKVREEYRVISRDRNGYKMDWVEAQATVEKRGADGIPLTLVGSLLVITQRKKMEEELTKARDEAQESNRLKSAFLANMSHEIRTPLNAIVGFSSLLNSTAESCEREEYIKIIENNNELLLQLIGDILDLSKIEAGTLEFVKVPVDVNALVKEIVKAMQVKVDIKGLILRFTQCLPECIILTDRNRLHQLLVNLLTNAIKFTDSGSIVVGYSLQENGMLRFFVTDTGCGIPSEKKGDIFTRFVKLNSFVQGTGLGLSICKTIIDKLGGEIGVDSELGKGSTFWFMIPAIPAERTEKTIQEYTLKAIAKDDVTILIVEDNVSNFKLFETILQTDYRILHAWNGVEAVGLFRQHNPHIVLMDISMPEMDGYQATTEIRKLSSEVPILAVTAYAYATDEEQILSRGFNGYASKPVNPSVLRSKIVDLLSTRLMLL